MSLAYEIARNLALGAPPIRARHLKRQLALGYDSDKDRPAYVRDVFTAHADAVGDWAPIAGDVLEIGPGGNFGVALLFLASGADSATCMDVLPLAERREQLDATLVANPARLYERLDYRCPEAIETTTLHDASFDIIYSHACLEKTHEPGKAVANVARLLRPGGITSHQIDLRDHRDFSKPLEFLRYSDRVWRLTSSRANYTNRWRLSDWTGAFAAAGLQLLKVEVTEKLASDQIVRSRLHSQFANLPAQDLVAAGAFIVARKPKKTSRHAQP